MTNMLLLGTENLISFRLALTGTALTPTVRVFLFLNTTVVYDAAAEPDGRWAVNITLPDDVLPGSYPLAIEVSVGGRIFTPLKTEIAVKRVEFEIEDLTFTPKRKPRVDVPAEEIEEIPEVKTEVKRVRKPILAKDTKNGVSDLLMKAFKEQQTARPVPPPSPPPAAPKVVPAPVITPPPAPVIAPTPEPAEPIPVQPIVREEVEHKPGISDLLMSALKEQKNAPPKVTVHVPMSKMVENVAVPVPPKQSALGDLLLSSLKEYAANPPELVAPAPVLRERTSAAPVKPVPSTPQVSDLLLKILREKNNGESIEAGTEAIAEAIAHNVPDSNERARLLELAGIHIQSSYA